MPDIGMLHPQVVHFVIALAFVGMIARIVSLVPIPKLSWSGPMAALLIILCAGASVVAVQSGTDAHEKAEAMPNVRPAVVAHEDWGHNTEKILLAIAAVEVLALAFYRKPAIAKGLLVLSAIGGLGGMYAVFRVGDLGGDLVYDYAGGIGLRSGDTVDVRHLLVAGLFNNARLDREEGNKEGSARMIDELARRLPNDPTIRMLAIESMMKDKNDARGALTALTAWNPPADNRRAVFGKATMTSDAYVALGFPDSARATLEVVKAKMSAGPGLQRIQAAIDKLPKTAPAPAAPVGRR